MWLGKRRRLCAAMKVVEGGIHAGSFLAQEGEAFTIKGSPRERRPLDSSILVSTVLHIVRMLVKFRKGLGAAFRDLATKLAV